MSGEISKLLLGARKESALAFDITARLERTIGALEVQIEELESTSEYLAIDPAELFPASPCSAEQKKITDYFSAR